MQKLLKHKRHLIILLITVLFALFLYRYNQIDRVGLYDTEGKTFYPVTEGDLQIGDYSFHTYYEDGGYEIEIAYTGE